MAVNNVAKFLMGDNLKDYLKDADRVLVACGGAADRKLFEGMADTLKNLGRGSSYLGAVITLVQVLNGEGSPELEAIKKLDRKVDQLIGSVAQLPREMVSSVREALGDHSLDELRAEIQRYHSTGGSAEVLPHVHDHLRAVSGILSGAWSFDFLETIMQKNGYRPQECTAAVLGVIELYLDGLFLAIPYRMAMQKQLDVQTAWTEGNKYFMFDQVMQYARRKLGELDCLHGGDQVQFQLDDMHIRFKTKKQTGGGHFATHHKRDRHRSVQEEALDVVFPEGRSSAHQLTVSPRIVGGGDSVCFRLQGRFWNTTSRLDGRGRALGLDRKHEGPKSEWKLLNCKGGPIRHGDVVWVQNCRSEDEYVSFEWCSTEKVPMNSLDYVSGVKILIKRMS